MNGYSPYPPYPPQVEPPQKKEDFFDGVANAARGADVALSVPGMFGATSKAGVVSTFNGIRGVLSNIPVVGGVFGKPSATKVLTDSVSTSAGEMFSTGSLGKLFAGVTFAARGAQAAGALIEGDGVKATGKLARGAAEAGVVFLNFTGLMAIPELACKIFTGKFMSTHAGDFVEGTVTKALGGTKEDKQRAAIAHMQPAMMVGAGMAAPAMRQAMMPDGTLLTFGGLPPAGAPMIAASPVMPRQVMAAHYAPQQIQAYAPDQLTMQNYAYMPNGQRMDFGGAAPVAAPMPGFQPAGADQRSAQYWQEYVSAQKADRGQGTGQPVVSGDPRFNPDLADKGFAGKLDALRQQQQQQPLTATLS